MNRREFITLLGGAAAWPLAARAQQPERVRRIGVLVASTADDPEAQARVAAFAEALSQLGWTDGRNLQIDVRWATTNADGLRRHAAELAALGPDVIVAATGTATVAPLLQATRTVPIVFAVVIDPVGAGFVASLARPGGNATGFTIFEYGLSGKWLELLKQVAPGTTRVAVLRDPTIVSGIGQFAAIQAVAPSLGVELSPVDVRDAPEIERAVTAFVRSSNGGLIVTPNALATRHRDLIITLAARHRLPAVYAWRFFAADGGLISYGPDLFDQYRRAAGYVDRILRGEQPADLPVQTPTRYELVIKGAISSRSSAARRQPGRWRHWASSSQQSSLALASYGQRAQMIRTSPPSVVACARSVTLRAKTSSLNSGMRRAPTIAWASLRPNSSA
jgi:putative ABC transport system substrate-binding protein